MSFWHLPRNAEREIPLSFGRDVFGHRVAHEFAQSEHNAASLRGIHEEKSLDSLSAFHCTALQTDALAQRIG
jgi:hypothetical protein